MTTATIARKTGKSGLRFIARATFKATGAVLYGIKSIKTTGEETIYHVTVLAGRVTGCHNAATGESCQGYRYSGKCKHTAYVERLELERAQAQNELDEAAVVADAILGKDDAQDLQAHLQDEMPAQDVPVAVWDCDKRYAYVLTGDLVECVYRGELDYFYPDRVEGEVAQYGSEVQRRLDAKRIVQRMSYRDLYAGDFNVVA